MSDLEPHHDWISVGEFSTAFVAAVVSQRLTTEGIPNRIVGSGFRRDPTCWIWVPPERADEAKALLAQDAVPDDELEKQALSYAPPGDEE